jgi:diacylglycerol kinase family enzyme
MITRRRALIVWNPSAGRIWRPPPVPLVVRRLAAAGLQAEVRSAGDFRPHDLLGRDLVVVVGGDGTLHHLLPFLRDAALPVGLVPAGTGNVLARELRLPRDPHRALDVLLEGCVRPLELAAADGVPFLLMAGAGLDGYLVGRVRTGLKRWLGVAAFWMAGLAEFWSYPLPAFRVHIGGESFEATQAFISNCRSYGGGLVLTPDADIFRPGFDVCILQSRQHRRYLLYLLKVISGSHRNLPDVVYRQGDRVRLEGPSSVLYQLDGEPAGRLPADLWATRETLPFLVPAETAEPAGRPLGH